VHADAADLALPVHRELQPCTRDVSIVGHYIPSRGVAIKRGSSSPARTASPRAGPSKTRGLHGVSGRGWLLLF